MQVIPLLLPNLVSEVGLYQQHPLSNLDENTHHALSRYLTQRLSSIQEKIGNPKRTKNPHENP